MPGSCTPRAATSSIALSMSSRARPSGRTSKPSRRAVAARRPARNAPPPRRWDRGCGRAAATNRRGRSSPTTPTNDRTNAARTWPSESRYCLTGWYSGVVSSAMVLRHGGHEPRVVGRQYLPAAQLACERGQPDAADADEDEDVGQREGEALAAE